MTGTRTKSRGKPKTTIKGTTKTTTKTTRTRPKSQIRPAPSGAAKKTSAKVAPADTIAAPLDDFIAAAGRALDLPVEPAWHGAIRSNLEVTLRLAAAFADFPLPDDAEPAPVFVA
jgi:hypothetical protein